MKILTVYAHQNPKSFCHAVLEKFSAGLKDAGHANDVVDLYAINFDPVLRAKDAEDVHAGFEMLAKKLEAVVEYRNTGACPLCFSAA